MGSGRTPRRRTQGNADRWEAGEAGEARGERPRVNDAIVRRCPRPGGCYTISICCSPISNPQAAFFNSLFSGAGFNSTGIGATSIATGRGGDIVLRTSRFSIRDRTPPNLNLSESDPRVRTGVTTVTFEDSPGLGGDILLEASESVELVGNRPGPFVPTLDDNVALTVIQIPAGLTTATNGRGDGGNLTINTQRLTIRDGAAATSGNSLISRGGQWRRFEGQCRAN